MEITKEEINEIIANSPMGYTRILSSKYKEFVDEKRSEYGVQPISEVCYLFINGMTAPAKCRCGINLRFIGFNEGYRQFCKKCYEINRQETALKNNQPDEAPKCANPSCNNVTYMKANGVWADHCTLDCRGRHNSAKSREKSKATMMKNHGVEHALQSKKIYDKLKDQNIERYGVDNVLKTQNVQIKIKHTNVDRYGFENPLSSPDIQEKVKKTNLLKYGVENPSESDMVKRRVTATMIERYGVRSAISANRGVTPEIYAQLNDAGCVSAKYADGGVPLLCEYFSISEPTAYLYLAKHGIELDGYTSGFEKKVRAFISGCYTGVIVTHNKTILGNRELDIYLPELNLAFECNGDYWHSELNGKDKNYHIDKTKRCSSKNIKLLHIWESDWNQNRPTIESLIKTSLGVITNRIYARNCDIREIKNAECNAFLATNHRQGSCPSKHRYGLYYKDELVQVITFGKSRFSKKYEHELLRLCSKLDTVIVGGASKLFSHFINQVNPTSIGSYADVAMNSGGVYEKLGFKYVHQSKPNYKYTNDYLTFHNRVAFQKHKLPDLLPIFDPELTEWENMKMNGYDRIWDCGNSLWIWRHPE